MKKYQKYIGPETNLQISAINYLDRKRIPCNHSANEIPMTWLKSKVIWFKLLAKRAKEGVKKGFPDVSIFIPSDQYHGLFIELKVGYNKPKPEQKVWLETLNSKGYLACWTNSLDEFIDIIEAYLDENMFLTVDENFKVVIEKNLIYESKKVPFESAN